MNFFSFPAALLPRFSFSCLKQTKEHQESMNRSQKLIGSILDLESFKLHSKFSPGPPSQLVECHPKKLAASPYYTTAVALLAYWSTLERREWLSPFRCLKTIYRQYRVMLFDSPFFPTAQPVCPQHSMLRSNKYRPGLCADCAANVMSIAPLGR